MTNEEAKAKELLTKLHGEKRFECDYDACKAINMGIKALAQDSITWIVGKDNCQVAVRNMPIDKMQKICAIIGEEEQQPSEDAVSREAIRQLICRNNDKYGYSDRMHELTEEIFALPSVQPQPRWIPVSERLPKYGKDVLTCDLGGFIEIQSIEYNVWDDYSYWENQKGDWTDFDEVTAWMPLPEPYKLESEVQL